MVTNEEIEQLLYSYDDWSVVAQGKVGGPYCFDILQGQQTLFYFGANHSRDINNLQYEKLRKYWQRFLDVNNSADVLVFVEGGERIVHETEELAVRRDSEAGFITLLAHRVGITTYSPEPGAVEERKYLLSKFSEENIDYYYFARLVNQWHNYPEPKADFNAYIGRYTEHKEPMTNWSYHGFPLERMKTIHEKLFGASFDERDKELFALLINPTRKDNPLRDVVIGSSTFRNIHMVQEIKRLWDDGKSLFVVYGSAHAILQEPALRKLLV